MIVVDWLVELEELTTQVSNTIQIGNKEIRPTFKRERYTISFIEQKNKITKENITVYKLPGLNKVLSTADKWNVV